MDTEQLDVNWHRGRVLCEHVDIEAGTKKIGWNSLWGLYAMPLTTLVPLGSFVALRKTRSKVEGQVDADVVAAMFQDAPAVHADRFRADLDDIADQDPAPRG